MENTFKMLQKIGKDKITYLMDAIIFAILTIVTFMRLGAAMWGLKIILVSCISCLISTFIRYIISDILSPKTINRFDGIFILILLIVYIPLLYSGIYFRDDFLNFRGYNSDFLTYSVSQGRPITGLLTDIMSFVTFEKSYYLRWISIGGVLCYYVLLTQMLNKALSKFQASLIAICLCLSIPIVNVIAYGSMFTYSWAFVASLLSVCYFEKWSSEKKKTPFIIAIALVFISNLIYQVTTTMAFLGLYILVNRKTHIRNVYYFGCFGSGSLVYLLFSKIISKYYGIPLMGRSEIIGAGDIISKIKWFLNDVCPQSVKQIAVSICGQKLIKEWNLTGNITFVNNIALIVVWSVVGLLLAVFTFDRIRQNLQQLIWTIILIPCSYYCFLILKETSYSSYYITALSSIFILILFDVIKKTIHSYRLSSILMAMLTLSFITTASYTVNHFWIGYNQSIYRDIKLQILNAVDQNGWKYNRAHIYGSVIPDDADIYMIRETQMALSELNLQIPEITSTSNRNVVRNMEDSSFNKLINQMSDEEIRFLKSMYIHDSNFSIYYLRSGEITEQDLKRLTDILVKYKVFPKPSTDVLIIDVENASEWM